MIDRQVSVRNAINRGIKQIVRPTWIILVVFTFLSVIPPLIGATWWCLLFFPVGLLLSYLYTSSVTPEWRIWAYKHVADIHQLQRSAELAGLLKRGAYDQIDRSLSLGQKAELEKLLERFGEDQFFFDDPSIPDEISITTNILFGIPGEIKLILNGSGIFIRSKGFLKWDEIHHDRVANVSFQITNGRGEKISSSHDYFRFETCMERYELPIAWLNTTAWELDLFLYIYRGRFAEQQSFTDKE